MTTTKKKKAAKPLLENKKTSFSMEYPEPITRDEIALEMMKVLLPIQANPRMSIFSKIKILFGIDSYERRIDIDLFNMVETSYKIADEIINARNK